MAYKTVAVAGATGNLGPHIVNELVNQGFQVTALSRSGIASGLPSSVNVVKVDFSSHDSLISALQGQEVFISSVPNHGDQPAYVDAAIAAGVKRFIPSEFGSNISGNKKAAALPVFAGKVKTQEYLRQKEDQISYTIVVNGLFLDWGIGRGLSINLKGETKIYDGGDRQYSSTLLSDIAKAVAGILKHPEETKNRTVYAQSALISQNKLLQLAQKKNPDFKPQTTAVDTKQLEQDGYAELKKENPNLGLAFGNLIRVSIYGEGFGSNWDDKKDNELLGIKGLSESELEDVIAKYF